MNTDIDDIAITDDECKSVKNKVKDFRKYRNEAFTVNIKV